MASIGTETCLSQQCRRKGQSSLDAIILRTLLELDRTLCTNDAERARIVAWKQAVRAFANMLEALQCRGSPNNILKALLYRIRRCCTCVGSGGSRKEDKSSLPLICLVPREDGLRPKQSISHPPPPSARSSAQSDFQLLDDDYIKKHFKLPKRALYLDPYRRPLITFPMTQEDSRHFNLARKYKLNQQILDGFFDPSEAISAPSVFPYGQTETEKRKQSDQEDEVIYILQLPDWEFKCPVHQETIRTPRFIWHSCKKSKEKSSEPKKGGGPLNKPKPWLLSRHTDFDLLSQW